MRYYVNKDSELPVLMSSNEELELENFEECTEGEYQNYQEELATHLFGTKEERKVKEVQENIRQQRKEYFAAFDIYKANLAYGIETETPEEKAEILTWYTAMLDLPDTINESNCYEPVEYPELPQAIARYI